MMDFSLIFVTAAEKWGEFKIYCIVILSILFIVVAPIVEIMGVVPLMKPLLLKGLCRGRYWLTACDFF